MSSGPHPLSLLELIHPAFGGGSGVPWVEAGWLRGIAASCDVTTSGVEAWAAGA